MAHLAASLPEADTHRLGEFRSMPYVHYPATAEPSGETVLFHNGIGMPATHLGPYPEHLAAMGHEVFVLGLAEEERSLAQRLSASWRAMAGAAVQAAMQPFQAPELWLSAAQEIMYEHRPPLTATFSRYARDAEAARDGLIGGPVHLGGVSWGGLLAQIQAMEYPDSTRSVTAVSTLPLLPLPFMGMPDPGALVAVASPWRPPEAAARILGGDFTDPAIREQFAHLVGRSIQPLTHIEQQQAIMYSFAHAWRNLTAASLRTGRLPAVPTAFVYGGGDPLIPEANVTIGAVILDAPVYTEQGGGHGVLVSRAERVAAITSELITRQLVEVAA